MFSWTNAGADGRARHGDGMLPGDSGDPEMLWMAEGKATCHLNGEGNKSQARQGPPPSDMGQRRVTAH